MLFGDSFTLSGQVLSFLIFAIFLLYFKFVTTSYEEKFDFLEPFINNSQYLVEAKEEEAFYKYNVNVEKIIFKFAHPSLYFLLWIVRHLCICINMREIQISSIPFS